VSVENCRYGKAKGKRQEARVKRVWAILHFFTQFGFIVFTYLHLVSRAILFKEMLWDQLVDLAIGKDDIQLTEYFHAL
jgi:hypothetical protein